MALVFPVATERLTLADFMSATRMAQIDPELRLQTFDSDIRLFTRRIVIENQRGEQLVLDTGIKPGLLEWTGSAREFRANETLCEIARRLGACDEDLK